MLRVPPEVRPWDALDMATPEEIAARQLGLLNERIEQVLG